MMGSALPKEGRMVSLPTEREEPTFHNSAPIVSKPIVVTPIETTTEETTEENTEQISEEEARKINVAPQTANKQSGFCR